MSVVIPIATDWGVKQYRAFPLSYGKFRVSDDLPYLGPAGRPKRAAQDR
jgi:hypothetical protein